jgi:MtrB/PioB family decaheme-associated outer membrane protein
MKTQKNTAFKISGLSAALMVVYGTSAFAADDEVAELINPKSSVSVGVGGQTDNRDQQGMFDGRKKQGGTLLLDADINKRDNATGIWTKLKVRDFGAGDRELEASYGQQGNYNLSYEYSRISREAPYTVNTSLIGIGTTTQTQIAAAAPGAGTTDLKLETHRNRSTLGFDKQFGDSFGLTVKYRDEEKKGLRHFGGNITNDSHPEFYVEPISSNTHQLDVQLNFLTKALQLQGGYYGSWYKNKYSFMTVTSATGVTRYMSLAPDNMSHQFFLNGSYALSPIAKATMRLSRSIGTQDDQRMRTGVPASEVWAGWGGVKARLVTNEAQAGVSIRPISNLSLLGNVYFQDRNDITPDVLYNAARDETTPRSAKKLNAKFEAAYRMQSGLKLLGGAYLDLRSRSIPLTGINIAPAASTNAGGNWTVNAVTANDREVPYREKNKEVTYKGQASKNLTDQLDGSLALAHSDRKGSSYLWGSQQNLVNPLHMADRERDKLGVKLDWSPTSAVSVQAQLDRAKDDYKPNGLNGDYTAPNGNTLYGTGIRDGHADLFSVDASFKLSDKWTLKTWYSRDESKATQYSFQNNFGPEPIRKAKLADIGDSLGIGVKGQATAKLTLGADLDFTRSQGKYQQANYNNSANLVEDLPDISSKALRIALNGIFQLDKKSAVRVDLVHERWNTNDWTWNMWNNAQTALVPYTYMNGVDSVTANNKQNSSSLFVRYKYDF